jgi:C-terminal processing protease CtpA/Prc
LSGSAFKAGHGFLLGLPVGAYLTWQGTLLEGKGVEPDEAVDLSRDALKDGCDTQLERAIVVVTAL